MCAGAPIPHPPPCLGARVAVIRANGLTASVGALTVAGRRLRRRGRRRGRKDKGAAILDYALDNRPSTMGEGNGRPAVSPTPEAPIGSWLRDIQMPTRWP
jgi:hypothetical protein